MPLHLACPTLSEETDKKGYEALIYLFQILGGKSLYKTGVTILDKNNELNKPPMSTQAKGV